MQREIKILANNTTKASNQVLATIKAILRLNQRYL